MSKINLLTAVACALLCAAAVSAQQKEPRQMRLDELFDLAAANSRQLKLSETKIKASAAAVSVAKGSMLPSIGVDLSGSFLGNAYLIERDLGSSTKVEMPHWGNAFSVEASQVIFAGGAIKHGIERAKLEEQSAHIDYAKEAMDIRFLLAGYYLDLYKLQNQKRVYQENIKQTRLLIEQVLAKQRQGMALDNDIIRHELLMKNLELAIIEIDNNYDIINNHLTVTLGLPATTLIVPDSAILQLNLSEQLSEQLLDEAEQNLPELKSSALQSKIADEDVRLAKADYYPSIAFVAANSFNGPITQVIPPIDKNLNYWYVGIGLKYNLSSVYKTRRNVKLAADYKQLADKAHDLVRDNVETAVYSAVTKYEETFVVYRTREKSLQLAVENYEVINNRYKNDLVLITEMLDASNAKLDAELQLVNARINIIFNYYKLQRTIGKL